VRNHWTGYNLLPVKLKLSGDLTRRPVTDRLDLIFCSIQFPPSPLGIRFSGVNAESAPTTVRIFMNKPNLAFAEAEDEPCTQDFDLTDGGVDFAGNTSKPLELKFVKFQNVQSLQIFISENGGADATELSYLELFGSTGEQSDISAWKPVKG